MRMLALSCLAIILAPAVGAAPPSGKHGKLISWLASHLAGRLAIPLVIVPGNLSDGQLAEIT